MSGVQIGSLHVSLSADAAVFEKGMDDAAEKSDSTVERITSGAMKMAGMLVAAYSAINFGQAVKEQIDYADALTDVAQRTGEAVENLSAMEYALHFNDAALEDYTGGLQKLSQNMADAAAGNAKNAAMFEAAGIAIKEQDGTLRKSGAVIMDFADKIAAMSDGAEKTALVIDVLGKSAGPALLPLLNQGSAGIRDLTNEAQRFGMVVTTETAEAAATLNDNLDKMQFQATGLWRTFAQQVTPALSDVAGVMGSVENKTTTLTRLMELLGTAANGAIRLVGGVGAKLSADLDYYVDKMGQGLALLEAGAKAAFESPTGPTPNAAQFATIFNDTSAVDNYNRRLKQIDETILGINGTSKETDQLFDSLWADKDRLELEAAQRKVTLDYLNAQQVAAEKLEKTQKAAAAAASARAKAEAEAVRQIADVDRLRQMGRSPIEAEEAAYEKSLRLLETATERAFSTKAERQELIERLEAQHQERILQIQSDGIEAAFADWAAGFDKRKAYEDKLSEDKKAADGFVADIFSDGADEITRMNEQHATKMQELARLREEELISQEQFNAAKIEAERQHNLKILDEKLGSGRKIFEVDNAFRTSLLNGALAFFAADFGGFSAHSKKIFALNKAAKMAQILLNIPATVSAAYKSGMEAGGPFGPAVGAAYAAAALAMQLGQLRQIQSTSFNGGGGGGGGPVGSAPALSNGTQVQPQSEQRADEQAKGGVTYVSIPEDAIITGRRLLDLLDAAVGDGKQPSNFRFVPA